MNPEKYRNRHGKIWINVASGNFFLEDFVNLDSYFLVFVAPFYPAIKSFLNPKGAGAWIEQFREGRANGHRFKFFNCAKPLNFPSDSVDHILASHFLEHLYPETVQEVVAGFHRVLKPGGTLHIIVPDIEIRTRQYVEKIGHAAAADEFVESTYFRLVKRPNSINRMLHAVGLSNLEHCWMYDRYSLLPLLEKHGFKQADLNQSPSLQWRREEWGQVNVLMQKRK